MGMLDCRRDRNWIGCIDFGTAYSKFAMVRAVLREDLQEKDIQPLPIAVAPGYRGRNPFLLPSLLFITDEAVLFGAEAEKRTLQTQGSMRRAFSSPKQFLSTHDLSDFDVNIDREIDPTGQFTPRILLSLFMAHLLERAGAHAKEKKLPWPIPLRIARPAWKGERAIEGENLLKQLVVTAFALVDRLGNKLSQNGGLPCGTAIAAFKKASTMLPKDNGIFKLAHDGRASVLEATAVAAGSIRRPGRRVVAVADIGGGTSDFGCFMTGVNPEKLVIAEIEGGSHILTDAGDYLDMQLRRLILERAGYLPDDPAAAGPVRKLLRQQRELKEMLFSQGEVVVEVGEEVVEITSEEFLSDKKVADFSWRLRERFHLTLKAATDCARCYPGQNRFLPQIEIMLTGGGHSLPMVKALIEDPSVPWSYTARAPELFEDEPNFDFQSVRRQLAVAIGGAMSELPVTHRIAAPAV